MANLFTTPFAGLLLGGFGSPGTNTGFALDSDFTLGTGGACAGLRFFAPPGGVHIHSVYWFLHAADAGGQNLTCHVADYGASSTRAGASIRSVTAAGGTAANKWVKFDFSAYADALTDNECYWVVVGDAAGVGNGYQIRTRNSANAMSATWETGQRFMIYTNAAGFTTNGTASSSPYAAIIVFSDGSVLGFPFTQSVADASSTLERGVKITGLTERLSIYGLTFQAGAANIISTLQIYEGTTAPGGTVWSGFNGGAALTLGAESKAVGFVHFPAVVTFEPNTVYRVTFQYSAAGTYPGYNEVEDAATPGDDAVACCLAQGRICRCIDDGAGGWTDTATQLPRMSLLVYDQAAVDTPAVGAVLESDTVRGAAGTYHEATEAEVQSGVAFGADSALTGTYSGGGGGRPEIRGGNL